MRLFKKIKTLNTLEKIFLTFLVFAQIFYSYRYIFRYGSPISPKGYVETPQIFQYGKFVLAFIFFVILSSYVLKKIDFKEIIKRYSSQKIWILILLFFFYITASLLKFGFSLDSFGFTQSLKMIFVIPFVFFIPFMWKDKNPFDFLKIFLVFSVVYHLIYNFLMIGMFYFFGRLPGLGFSDILGRFGGGWDDPNSFAAFIVLLIITLVVFDFNNKRLKKRLSFLYIFLLALLTISLLYTFSTTSLVGLVLSLAILLFLKRDTFKRIGVVFITTATFSLIFYALNYFNLIYNAKLASSKVHLAVVPSPAQNPGSFEAVINFIFGSSGPAGFNENIYLQLFKNFGITAVFLFLIILGLTAYKSFKGWKNSLGEEKKNFFLVSFVYLMVFSFMNLGIPFFQSFPLNLFVWIMIGLVWIFPGGNYVKNES